MAEELRLKTNVQPTLLNKEMRMGLLAGAVLPFGLAAMPLTSILVLAAAGGLIGGVIGKNRMEEEARDGKRVGAPTALNKDTIIGGLSGYIWGNIAGIAAGFVLAELAPISLAAFSAIATIGAIAGAAIGAIKGGNKGKAEMEAEYKLAMVQQQLERSRTRAPEVSHEPRVAMDVGTSKNFAERLEQERQRMAAQALQKH